MTSINPVYVVAPQQQSQKNRTAAHIGNATVATAGLGATGFAARDVIKDATGVFRNEVYPLKDGYGHYPKKLYRFFELLGQGLFGKHTGIGQSLERFVNDHHGYKNIVYKCINPNDNVPSKRVKVSPEVIEAYLKKYRTLGAVGVVAAPLVLGILGLAAYKAGKIDG